ncbi:dihydroorotate dehydrogenase electron transfer subunit [Chloroflexota bacterium]
MKQIPARVISNEVILPYIARPGARTIISSHIIWLKCPEIARDAKPGQFIMASCGGECVLRRPFSIHQVNNDDIAILFSVWEDGKGTGWLSQRKAGDNIDLLGPLGNGYSLYPGSRHLLLVAGGIGIAPLYFLAQAALKAGYTVKLLYGAQTEAQIYPHHLLPPGIDLATATNDGTASKKGQVTTLLPHSIDWSDQVLACGPVTMYRDMYARRKALLKSKPVQVSLEAIMGCGYGVCYGCTVKTRSGLKQVCSDGPVFDLRDIIWDEIASEQ